MAAVILDKRNDPFNPTEGSLHGVNVKEATKALNSRAEFSKATVQSTWYVPAAEYLVLALSGRAGMGWPHRDTREVPLHERFYLGGGTTVRGYTQDSVGPYNLSTSGDRVPTGGSAMVQFNAELRLNSAEGSGIVFFSDAGNVWVDQSIRMNDLRASYGAGFRYHTPVGPLRVDYGQKIHRRSGESPASSAMWRCFPDLLPGWISWMYMSRQHSTVSISSLTQVLNPALGGILPRHLFSTDHLFLPCIFLFEFLGTVQHLLIEVSALGSLVEYLFLFVKHDNLLF